MALSIKHFLYLCLVAFSAFTLAHYLKNPQAYWLIWSALIFSLITRGFSFTSRMLNILLTGMIAAVVTLIVSWSVAVLPFLGFLELLVLLFCGILLGQLYGEMFLPTFYINLFAVMGVAFPAFLDNSLQRLLLILGGLTIAACFQLIFLPRFIKDQLRSLLQIELYDLKKLSGIVFAYFLEPDSSENIYLVERKLHLRKMHFLRAHDELRHLSSQEEKALKSHNAKILNNMEVLLEEIFEIILYCATLRFRVRDYTIFTICRDELRQIWQALEKLFNSLSLQKSISEDTNFYLKKVAALKENYEHFLKVSSQEPLVFLLFIDRLQILANKLSDLFKLKTELKNSRHTNARD